MNATRPHNPALLGLLIVVIVYTALAVTYGATVPVFESPDEVGHFFTVKYIADHGRLPPPDRDTAFELSYGQEGTQPPLYYLLGATIVRALDLETESSWELLVVNPHTTCGSPQLTGNKAFLEHNPQRDRFPWTGAIRTIHILRLYSTVLGLAALVMKKPNMNRIGTRRNGSGDLQIRRMFGKS